MPSKIRFEFLKFGSCALCVGFMSDSMHPSSLRHMHVGQMSGTSLTRNPELSKENQSYASTSWILMYIYSSGLIPHIWSVNGWTSISAVLLLVMMMLLMATIISMMALALWIIWTLLVVWSLHSSTSRSMIRTTARCNDHWDKPLQIICEHALLQCWVSRHREQVIHDLAIHDFHISGPSMHVNNSSEETISPTFDAAVPDTRFAMYEYVCLSNVKLSPRLKIFCVFPVRDSNPCDVMRIQDTTGVAKVVRHTVMA